MHSPIIKVTTDLAKKAFFNYSDDGSKLWQPNKRLSLLPFPTWGPQKNLWYQEHARALWAAKWPKNGAPFLIAKTARAPKLKCHFKVFLKREIWREKSVNGAFWAIVRNVIKNEGKKDSSTPWIPCLRFSTHSALNVWNSYLSNTEVPA